MHSTDLYIIYAARKRYIESKLQALKQESFTIDAYPRLLDSAKDKRDNHKRFPVENCRLFLHTPFHALRQYQDISVLHSKHSSVSGMFVCSKYNMATGMRQMFEPFEQVAREHHFCPCCERTFSAEEEDSFVKKVSNFLLEIFPLNSYFSYYLCF